MSKPLVPLELTLHVRDVCLCLHTQRAARVLARLFDNALRPCGLTNGQFSLLMSVNRPDPVKMAPVAALLAVDRTTLTAALKPLERRGLVQVLVDPADSRGRLLRLTADGHRVLSEGVPIWTKMHAALESGLGDPDAIPLELANLSRRHGHESGGQPGLVEGLRATRKANSHSRP